MGNLTKKSKEIVLGNKKYIMCFDMNSINLFQELSGMGFLNAIHLINKYDDKILLYFMASSIRPKDNPEVPIGEKLFEFDIIGLLLSHTLDVIQLVSASMPQVSNNKEIDIDWLYYVYTTILNRQEREFWNSTLRKVISQINIHNDLYKNQGKNSENTFKENTEVLKVI